MYRLFCCAWTSWLSAEKNCATNFLRAERKIPDEGDGGETEADGLAPCKSGDWGGVPVAPKETPKKLSSILGVDVSDRCLFVIILEKFRISMSLNPQLSPGCQSDLRSCYCGAESFPRSAATVPARQLSHRHGPVWIVFNHLGITDRVAVPTRRDRATYLQCR